MSCTGYHMPHNVVLPDGKPARLMCAECRVEIPSSLVAESVIVRALADRQPDQRGGEVGDAELGEAARRVCLVLWGRDRMWESPIADQCIAIARAALAAAPRPAEKGEGERL